MKLSAVLYRIIRFISTALNTASKFINVMVLLCCVGLMAYNSSSHAYKILLQVSLPKNHVWGYQLQRLVEFLEYMNLWILLIPSFFIVISFIFPKTKLLNILAMLFGLGNILFLASKAVFYKGTLEFIRFKFFVVYNIKLYELKCKAFTEAFVEWRANLGAPHSPLWELCQTLAQTNSDTYTREIITIPFINLTNYINTVLDTLKTEGLNLLSKANSEPSHDTFSYWLYIKDVSNWFFVNAMDLLTVSMGIAIISYYTYNNLFTSNGGSFTDSSSTDNSPTDSPSEMPTSEFLEISESLASSKPPLNFQRFPYADPYTGPIPDIGYGPGKVLSPETLDALTMPVRKAEIYAVLHSLWLEVEIEYRLEFEGHNAELTEEELRTKMINQHKRRLLIERFTEEYRQFYARPAHRYEDENTVEEVQQDQEQNNEDTTA
jgi:hypothetical protein